MKRGVNATEEHKQTTIATLRETAVDKTDFESISKIDRNKPLTEKQKSFVKHWAQGESILSASARAGYNDGGTYAYRLVRMPNVLALYEREKQLYEEAAQLTRKKVMDMHIEAYEMAKLMAEPSTMVAAARELGKMAGYYEPVKKQIDINVSGNVVMDRLNKLSDAELLKLITTPVQEAIEHDDDDDDEDAD